MQPLTTVLNMCCFHSVSGTNTERVAEPFWVDFCGIFRLNEAKCEACWN